MIRPSRSLWRHSRLRIAWLRSSKRRCSSTCPSCMLSGDPFTQTLVPTQLGKLSSSGTIPGAAECRKIPAMNVAGAESRLPSSSDPRVPALPLLIANKDSISCSRARVKPSATRNQFRSLACLHSRFIEDSVVTVSKSSMGCSHRECGAAASSGCVAAYRCWIGFTRRSHTVRLATRARFFWFDAC